MMSFDAFREHLKSILAALDAARERDEGDLPEDVARALKALSQQENILANLVKRYEEIPLDKMASFLEFDNESALRQWIRALNDRINVDNPFLLTGNIVNLSRANFEKTRPEVYEALAQYYLRKQRVWDRSPQKTNQLLSQIRKIVDEIQAAATPAGIPAVQLQGKLEKAVEVARDVDDGALYRVILEALASHLQRAATQAEEGGQPEHAARLLERLLHLAGDAALVNADVDVPGVADQCARVSARAARELANAGYYDSGIQLARRVHALLSKLTPPPDLEPLETDLNWLEETRSHWALEQYAQEHARAFRDILEGPEEVPKAEFARVLGLQGGSAIEDWFFWLLDQDLEFENPFRFKHDVVARHGFLDGDSAPVAEVLAGALGRWQAEQGQWDPDDIHETPRLKGQARVRDKHLDLAGLDLTNLLAVADLPELYVVEELDLGSNRLTRVPSLWFFPFLRYLNLSENELEEVPGFSDNPGLQSLDLSYNHLAAVSHLEGLAALEHVDLAGNPLPDEVLVMSARELVAACETPPPAAEAPEQPPEQPPEQAPGQAPGQAAPDDSGTRLAEVPGTPPDSEPGDAPSLSGTLPAAGGLHIETQAPPSPAQVQSEAQQARVPEIDAAPPEPPRADRKLEAVKYYKLGLRAYQAGEYPKAVSQWKVAVSVDPGYVKVWKFLGNAYFKTRDFQAARDAYKNALQADADDPLAWYGYGVARKLVGDLDGAIVAFENVVSRDPGNEDAWLELARVLKDTGDAEGALDAYEQVADHHPEDGALWSDVAGLGLKVGDKARARVAFQRVVALDPGDHVAWFKLGFLEYEAGDLDAAVTAWRRAGELNPQNAAAWYNLGTVYHGRDEFPAALFYWQQAAALGHDKAFQQVKRLKQKGVVAQAPAGASAIACGDAPGTPSPVKGTSADTPAVPEPSPASPAATGPVQPETQAPQTTTAEGWFDEGYQHQAQGEFDAAITAYHESLALDPEQASAWANIGTCKQELGDLEGAIIAYEQAVSLDARNILIWQNLAAVRQNTGDLQGALDAYDHALTVSPDDPNLWYYAGVVKFALEDFPGAATAWTKTTELAPEYAPAWNSLGVARKELWEVDRALEAFNQAITLDPSYLLAWDNLAQTYFFQGAITRAVEAVETAVRLCREAGDQENLALVSYNAAIYHAAGNDVDAATRHLQTAIDLRPEYKTKARESSDFAAIRDHPKFQRVVA